MTRTEIVVVGGGPAGLAASLAASRSGAKVLLIERQAQLGGQLVKQTHRFFGSSAQSAGVRGITIARDLAGQAASMPEITVWTQTEALGYYAGGTLLAERPERVEIVQGARMVLCVGASERPLAFPNNDLPGVYGAGAVQTLMNVYGVLPGRRVVMVGAGNIGLIVSYQLLQAGVEVAAILEAAPQVGGYLVHAAKIARAGVPIMTSHSVVAAFGETELVGIRAARLGPDWRPVPGTGFDVDCDVLCLAVGLSPLVELARLVGCEVCYIPELGGYVPVHDDELETTVPGVYVAGDAAGVEEASSALIEGHLAGLAAAHGLYPQVDYEAHRGAALAELEALRAGPTGAKIRVGLSKMAQVKGGGRQ